MDLENTPHRDPEVIEISKKALASMPDLSSALRYATIVTEDGFEVASVSKSITNTGDDRVAAMVSSISALSDAIASTLEINDSEYVVINAKDGIFVVRRVNNSPLVLAGVFDKKESLGKALVAVDLIKTELSKLLGIPK